MNPSIEPGDGDPGASVGCPADGHATEAAAAPVPCPRCRALEDRIAALEAELAALRAAGAGGGPAEAATSAPASLPLPPLEFKALRLIPYGWGEGWGLRPSPSRRHWMDEHEHAYHCLPLVIANQWGWQVLCPTEV